ncbi:glycosyltransferase family 2 protein [Nibricoccus sp. IMCC34717]|uniref:glycosyltransferase family 2 protein n=1 Tax=Nibricoccus sp. IMCC34717 TaxID=3034021 RepID=UPI00384FA566
MPCLNEAETLEVCIRKAQRWLAHAGVEGEVLIADNGSTDGSRDIATRCGARVEPIAARGYGAALSGGIAAARGRFVIMGDADDSYDFEHLDPFVAELRAGAALVMGNRFRGGIANGAMPKLHFYLGNPVLTAIGRLLFRSPCRDFHCGLRGFNREAILALDLRTTGMEFASEMVVKATLARLKIVEVPTTLKKDGRSRPPHLRSWRDGWRHLRFLLMYSPRWLFVLPGLTLLSGGLALGAWLLPEPRTIGGVSFDIHTLLAASAMIVLGLQALVFGVLTKVFAISEGLLPEDPQLNSLFNYITLETGLIVGALLTAAGLVACGLAVGHWSETHFSNLDPQQTMRVFIPGVTAIVVGCQTILASFFLSILGLRRRG